MNQQVKHIVILGGGSAGWLTAGVLAAEHMANDANGIQVTLVESPDIKTVGVGEGTWPSMRTTLQKMGVSETDFIRCCDAAFKQGSKFAAWHTNNVEDAYYHPFSLPAEFSQHNLAMAWQQYREQVRFDHAVSFQSHICDRGLAPKQIATPEYAFVANYGYHLDAGKFAQFLTLHCTEKLGVKHIQANVLDVTSHTNGDIASLITDVAGEISGDLFIDCSGSRSRLLGEHLGINNISLQHYLFNNTALAVHVPYNNEQQNFASHTLSTGQSSGWTWDIALPSRRGCGYVFSDAHTSLEDAEHVIRNYVAQSSSLDYAKQAELKQIKFNPGHKQKFWHNNCVAVGMAAGFIEPLEASALVLVELSAQMISEQLPQNRQVMDIVAARFNDKFSERWQQIVDFLKVHYVLSKRDDSAYWLDNRDESTIPQNLQDNLNLWRYQSPWHFDATHTESLFSSASYQYVLYGMGFETLKRTHKTQSQAKLMQEAERLFAETARKSNQVVSQLPTNRELNLKIHQYGFQKI